MPQQALRQIHPYLPAPTSPHPLHSESLILPTPPPSPSWKLHLPRGIATKRLSIIPTNMTLVTFVRPELVISAIPKNYIFLNCKEGKPASYWLILAQTERF